MKTPVRTEPQSLAKPAALGLGERLRRLRVAAVTVRKVRHEAPVPLVEPA